MRVELHDRDRSMFGKSANKREAHRMIAARDERKCFPFQDGRDSSSDLIEIAFPEQRQDVDITRINEAASCAHLAAAQVVIAWLVICRQEGLSHRDIPNRPGPETSTRTEARGLIEGHA